MTAGDPPGTTADADGGALAAENARIEVRPMTAVDVDAALAMFSAVAAEGLWLGAEGGFDVAQRRAAWLTDLDDPSRRSFVAVTDDGRVVANSVVAVTSYGVADIGMAVADGWRGRGLGGRLLHELVASARELGAHKVALQVWPHNTRAIELYRSRGFVEEGRLRRHYRRRNGELWDAVIMGLVLDEGTPGSPHRDAPRLGLRPEPR
jgi:RimJ/RimL family protein N-acetyltransferase